MCNIKVMELVKVSNIKSVFMLSIAQKMSLESLTIYHCDELEHIVVDNGDGSGIGVNIIFPKLKNLNIFNCKKLEYIFGDINAGDDQQYHHQNHLHIPALKFIEFYNLPSLLGMGTKIYTMLSHLEVVKISKCPQVSNKSIGDFVYSMSKAEDTTTTKVLYTPLSIYLYCL
jgi:hypothetical protein